MRKALIFLFTLFLAASAWAAFDPVGISMSASVNKTSLTMEDEITLTVTVEDAVGDFAPSLPSLPAFNVYGRSTIQQINNFHTTTIFEYIMLPRFPGKTVIGPITLHYGNKTYETKPISVTVYRADRKPAQTAKTAAQVTKQSARKAAAPSAQAPANMPALERNLYNLAAKKGSSAYFMVAALSNDTPYVGQTVTMAVRFYYSRAFVGSAPYTSPSISNLFMEAVGNSEGQQLIDNTMYAYSEKRYTVSGVTAGKAFVGPATVSYTPSSADLSVFDRMFTLVSQNPVTVESNSLNLTIRPLPPQDQPASFYGAVGGEYAISASVDRTQVEAGEAVNLTVKVNGPGNLKPTTDLKIPELTGFKVYDAASSSGAKAVNGALQSYKIFKTVIVPLSSGTYTVPALAWSYFDPKTKRYKTIYTEPISLEVSPSSQTGRAFDFSAQSNLDSGVHQLSQDIRYIKSAPMQSGPAFLEKLAGLGLVNYVALALLVLAGAFALTDKKTLAGKRAAAKIRTQLKNANTEEEVASALSNYLQQTYGVHTGSLPLRDISAALKQKHCPAVLVERFEILWKRLDAARFAPVNLQGDSAHELAQEATALIKDMDKGPLK